jgi:hypothetical protein
MAAFLAALALPAIASAQDMPKAGGMAMKAPASKTATITGTVVDVSCKFGQGLSGAEHKMCAEVCSDRGLPLAILGDNGKLYIPASAGMPGDAQNGKLKPFAEQRVTVSGKVFSAGGAEAIQISSIAATK